MERGIIAAFDKGSPIYADGRMDSDKGTHQYKEM